MKLSSFIVAIWWMVEIVDFLLPFSIQPLGLHPHNVDQWWGIFTYPFIHGDWEHLSSNSLSGIILLTSLFVFHPKKAFSILPILYVFSGILLWFIGEKGSNHIGASGLIYALAFFLFTSGAIIRERNTLAVSFFIIMWYGSMIWGIFPFSVESGVSWEGHLSGAIVGVALAFILYWKQRKRKSIESEEEEEAKIPFYELHPLD
ncbi:MAG: rhomboid family intramembrane serine protease [Chitinophagales bacterium]